ncbi:hypothetical protein A2U01_0041198, partial [Trifolium medium]|nr:hypothetical protein [Trifolium medium]
KMEMETSGWGLGYMDRYHLCKIWRDHSPHLGGRLVGLRGSSSWWRDVSMLWGAIDSISDWLSEGIEKKVGNGLLTSFWFEPWFGEIP